MKLGKRTGFEIISNVWNFKVGARIKKESEDEIIHGTIEIKRENSRVQFNVNFPNNEIMINDFQSVPLLQNKLGKSLLIKEQTGMSYLFPDTWFIEDNPVGQLYVNFDICSYIVEYSVVIDGIYTTATCPFDDTIPNNITVYEKERYNVAKAILGKRLPPKIQINEFEIRPDEIQCNEPQELYRRGGSNNSSDCKPVCLTPQTHQMMLKRGVDQSRYDDPKNTQCGESQELYRRGDTDNTGDDTPVCLTQQTYEALLKRGVDLQI